MNYKFKGIRGQVIATEEQRKAFIQHVVANGQVGDAEYRRKIAEKRFTPIIENKEEE